MPRQRMAFEGLPQTQRTIVRDALRPWERRLGVLDSNTGQFNADLWEGQTAQGFINRHDIVRDDLAEMIRSGDVNTARKMLINQNNHNLEDANQQIMLMQLAAKGRLGNITPETLDLQKLKMSVPQAEADEHLARAALELSGWKNVESLKDGTTRATDIIGEYGGYDTLVDAQSRTGAKGRLNLGLISDLNINADDIQRRLRDTSGSTKVMDFVRQARDKSRSFDRGNYESGKEGKLLATMGSFNDSPTRHFQKHEGVLTKDGIITSDRRQPSRSIHPDHPRLIASSSPFNPELPKGWDLIDLNEAREVLSKLTIGDLRSRNNNQGFQMFINPSVDRRTAKINIGIGAEKLKQLTGDLGGISPLVNQVLVA